MQKSFTLESYVLRDIQNTLNSKLARGEYFSQNKSTDLKYFTNILALNYCHPVSNLYTREIIDNLSNDLIILL